MRKNIVSQAKHTRITLITVPYRYDRVFEETKPIIDAYNSKMIDIVYKEAEEEGLHERVQVVDINKYVCREDYTKHGLHLNQSGKAKLGSIIGEAITEFGKLNILTSKLEAEVQDFSN